MKRDFLKDLGIESKEIIDKILDENSADIGRAKGDTDELKTQIKSLETQLSKKTEEFDALKESTKDYSDLTAKIKQLDTDNAQLIADKKQLEVDLDAKVSQILKNHAIESGVRDAKARNLKAVMAQLDMDKITYKDGELSGLTEQLDALKTGDDTSFLFGEAQPTAPSGTHVGTPKATGGNPPTAKTFADAIAKTLGKN